jgi:hypothetical protein
VRLPAAHGTAQNVDSSTSSTRGTTLNARHHERLRIAERLPVARAELNLDRAGAQSRAEPLAVVDGVGHARVGGKAQRDRAGGDVRGSDLDVRIDGADRVAESNAGCRRGPLAGATQVASDQLGGATQVLHQSSLDLDAPR